MDKREVFTSIAADLSQGDLIFPTSARVALKLRQALDAPDCHLDTALQLVQAEPLLSARVIAMANSAAFNRSGRELMDVRSSMVRLGFGTIRVLAVALVTRQLAGNVVTGSKWNLANRLWEHSAYVASLARVMAQHVTNADPEAAMFAGIVHEIGGFYLLSRAREFPGLLDGDFTDWTQSGEAQVGRALLGVLAVPSSVQRAIEEFWQGDLNAPPGTLGDTLLLSDELAQVPSPLRSRVGLTPDNDIKAKIDLAVGQEALSSILMESAVEIESLKTALTFL